jgi:hypothetical protein
MWDELSQTRWNELCHKRQVQALTDTEQQEWEELVRRLEADEWAQLQPTIEHLREENSVLERACLGAEQEKARLLSLVAQRRAENDHLQARLRTLEQEYSALASSRRLCRCCVN